MSATLEPIGVLRGLVTMQESDDRFTSYMAARWPSYRALRS